MEHSRYNLSAHDVDRIEWEKNFLGLQRKGILAFKILLFISEVKIFTEAEDRINENTIFSKQLNFCYLDVWTNRWLDVIGQTKSQIYLASYG